MKSKLYSILFIAILFLTSSCKKWLPENRIEGDWELTQVEKRRLFDYETINSGFEEGRFTFFENGRARFTNANETLSGYWQMRKEDNGYYDPNGNWQSDGNRILIVNLYNFSNNQVVEWYFNRFDFRSAGNRLFAFIESPNYNYRYCFTKK